MTRSHRTILCGLTLGALLIGSPIGGSAFSDAFGVLVEAEDYAKRDPATRRFALFNVEPYASGGANLWCYKGERYRCVYDFEIPEKGTYHVWLRYASYLDGEIRIAIDPGSHKNFMKSAPVTALPSTKHDVGPGWWTWVKVAEADLEPGKHRLMASGAAARPDCYWITSSTAAPTDAVADLAEPRKPSATERELLARPLAPVTPEWVVEQSGYRLPHWFDDARVCAHTRLGPRTREEPVFYRAAQGFARMGFPTMSRHIKSNNEGAWWPSKVGHVEEWARNDNVAKKIIDNAHAAGLPILVYHRHMEDAHMAEQHPDWVCVDWKGRPLSRKRGHYMCHNSPYLDFFLTRMLELVDMGADGFYFDEAHMPSTGCWCPHCRERFRKETGLEAPPRANAADPVWHKYIDFKNLTIERGFLHWRRGLHARNPDVVMLVSANEYPGAISRHFTHRLMRISDSVKTEFNLAGRSGKSRVFYRDESLRPTDYDVRVLMGHAICRDGADGRPPHIWTARLTTEDEALYAAAGMIAHGCVANLDVPEGDILTATRFNKAVDLGARVSPLLARRRPLRWAAVHFAEGARDRRLPDQSKAWKEVLYPMFGVFKVMTRNRLPVRLINDSQLEQGMLDGYRLLFLPDIDSLTEKMKAAVQTFEALGGIVVGNDSGWKWHGRDGGHEEAMNDFTEAIGREIKRAPAQVFGGNEKMTAQFYPAEDGKRLTVALVNHFMWVHHKVPKSDDSNEMVPEPAPGPCKDVSVVVRGRPEPTRVRDAVTGADLKHKVIGDEIWIEVPEFAVAAFVSVE